MRSAVRNLRCRAHTHRSHADTRQISDTIEDIYGFGISEGMVSDITDKLLPQIEDWQNRPLSEVYPIVFIDAVHFSVRKDGIIQKMAAYVVLGINDAGRKDVLSIVVGENESSKFWLGVLNNLKNRGVQDILIICSDGLTGIKEAITAAYPNRTPKPHHLEIIAQALGISPFSLMDPNLDSEISLMHSFYYLEDNYDLQVKKDGGVAYICFDVNTAAGRGMQERLQEWADMKESLSKEEYEKWKDIYPAKLKK